MIGVAADHKKLIESFIHERVTDQGLDRRTEKAYRLDLEHFYAWLGQKERRKEEQGLDSRRGNGGEAIAKLAVLDGKTEEKGGSIRVEGLEAAGLEECAEDYLDHLAVERVLSPSTICRKNRVLGYYLSYLAGQGMLSGCRPLSTPLRGRDSKKRRGERNEKEMPEQKEKERSILSRKDADAFFTAMSREYEELDSAFRRRICLRDMVMMELLFCHKIEISELLRMQIQDYDPKTGGLQIRRKREKGCSVYLYSKELRRKLEWWLEERVHLKRDGEYGEIMFLSKFGRPLSMEMVVKIFDKYRVLAGIPGGFTPRDLKEGVMKGYARELVMERWG